jgi:hypothetical protein
VNGDLLQCPKCHRADSVQKVSAVVKNGTSESILKGQNISTSYNISANQVSIGGGSFTAKGTQNTLLSQQLSLINEKPKQTTNRRGCLLFLSLPFFLGAIIALLGIVSGYTKNLSGSLLMVIIFGAIGALILTPYMIQRKRDQSSHMKALQKWRRDATLAQERWNQLYYCHRCDGVFIPGKPLVPTEKMSAYFLDI